MAVPSVHAAVMLCKFGHLNGNLCVRNIVNSIGNCLNRHRRGGGAVHLTSCGAKSFSSSDNGEASQPTADVQSPKDRDPGPLFIDTRVQTILKRLTGMNMDKIFEFRATASNKRAQRYKFMTEKELREAMVNVRGKAEQKLQMPPVLQERKPIDEVLSRDPELIGLNTCKIIFTDISIGVPNRKRFIVVRDPDGTLRKASWEERDRMMLTFFPKPLQKYGTPRVFLDEHMATAFDAGKYKFVLDRACHQYEPDDPAFIRICHKAYEHVDNNKNYDILHSTRHYGPLVFHLVFYKRIDNILQYLLQKDRIDEAADVVRLYHIIQPDCKSRQSIDETAAAVDHLTILKIYTENDAVQRSHLELALQTHEELARQQREYDDDVKKAHGYTESSNTHVS